MVNLKCKRCGKEWDYNGKSKIYVSCPDCKHNSKLNDAIACLRENGKCKECNSTNGLEIHHIIPRQEGISDSINNLVLLCNKCHQKKGISNRKNKNRKIVQLNVTFEDDEFDQLDKQKGKSNWHEFIMTLVKTKRKVVKDGAVSEENC